MNDTQLGRKYEDEIARITQIASIGIACYYKLQKTDLVLPGKSIYEPVRQMRLHPGHVICKIERIK